MNPQANTIRELGMLSLGFFGIGALIIAFGDLLTKGQDAAGQGMYPAILAMIFWIPALVISVVAAWLASKHSIELDITTKLLGWLPLFLICGFLSISFFVSPY
jgi:hypothetical protein